MAGVGLCLLPYTQRPAAQPVAGPAHLPEQRSAAAPPVQWTGDAAEEGLPAPPAAGAHLLPAALAGSPDPPHLLPGVQAVE